MNQNPTPRVKSTTTSLRLLKGTRKIAAVTAYDASFAKLFDEAQVDLMLVGDTLGMVVQGCENTLSVTVEDIIYHTRAVSRGTEHALVVADLPFMSYQVSAEKALESAGRLLKEGMAEAVKLEGGRALCGTVERIVQAGIPVMGHIGLLPQSVHAIGGFRVQGKGPGAVERLIDDARALEAAGAFSIVLEAIPREVARAVTESVSVPTIGIGAGPDCDGQVLVCYDLLGLFQGFVPRFVKRYAEMGQGIVDATRAYVAQVQSGAFPADEHCFGKASVTRQNEARYASGPEKRS